MAAWDTALAKLGEALALLLSLGDRTTIGSLFSECAEALTWAGRYEDAARVARRVLEHLDGDLSADQVRLLSALGLTHATAAVYEPAEEALREALNLASQLFDQKLIASGL